MKNSKKSLSLAAGIFAFSAAAGAADYYFNLEQFIADTGSADQVNLSSTISADGSLTYWYSDSSFTQAVTDASFSFLNDAQNDIYFGDGTSTALTSKIESRSILVDVDFNVNSVTSARQIFSDAATNFFKSASPSNPIIIGEYKNVSNSETLGFGGADTVLHIGTITMRAYNFGSYASPIKYAEVENMLLHEGNNRKASYFAAGDGSGSIDSPDIKIGTLSSSYNAAVGSSLLLYGNTSFMISRIQLDTNHYAQIGAVTGTAGLGMTLTNESSAGSVTYILTGSSTSSTSGSIVQLAKVLQNNNALSTDESFYTTAGAKLNLVMKSLTPDGTSYADGSQSFGGDIMVISGDVSVISGSLYINYAGLGNSMNKGVLRLAKASGANTARIGNSNGAVGGTYMFSVLEVSDGGGTIQVRLDMNDDGGLICDTLAFSEGATGSGTVVLELKNFNGNNPDDFIDLMIENETSLKVISWSQAAEAGINFTTTDDYLVYDYYGTDYYFTVTNAADGLYISYQIPEPGLAAAIFGGLAAALAVGRRMSGKAIQSRRKQ